ncbi:MAG: hypothetical protein K8S23_03650 [Candidatus Cloacimonetes bacterium]|nr:hypothetical protein [Candidatus Cloacimonadota bacterium]
MKICEVCGNEIDDFSPICPFCGNGAKKTRSSSKQKSDKYVTKNIKIGMPTCEQAIKMVKSTLFKASYDNTKVIKIIHGYGSSGVGGELRYCLREYFQQLCGQGKLKFFVSGKDFSRTNPNGKRLLSYFPKLSNDKDLNRSNRGITFIVI